MTDPLPEPVPRPQQDPHEVLKGDARRQMDTYAIAPDYTSLFVFWQSTQGDLWLVYF